MPWHDRLTIRNQESGREVSVCVSYPSYRAYPCFSRFVFCGKTGHGMDGFSFRPSLALKCHGSTHSPQCSIAECGKKLPQCDSGSRCFAVTVACIGDRTHGFPVCRLHSIQTSDAQKKRAPHILTWGPILESSSLCSVFST